MDSLTFYYTDEPAAVRTQAKPMETQCSCSNMRLARTYVLPQTYRDMFPINETVSKGTAFKELYMPYPPGKINTQMERWSMQ